MQKPKTRKQKHSRFSKRKSRNNSVNLSEDPKKVNGTVSSINDDVAASLSNYSAELIQKRLKQLEQKQQDITETRGNRRR